MGEGKVLACEVENQTLKPKFKTLFKQSENLKSLPDNQIITSIGTKLNNFADLLGLNSFEVMEGQFKDFNQFQKRKFKQS